MRIPHVRAACLTAVATVAVLVPAPADAFPTRANDCPLRSPKIWYNLTGSGWDETGGSWYDGETYRSVAQRAFARWVIPENRDGTSIARMSPASFTGARRIDVYFSGTKDYHFAYEAGGFDCGMDDIYLDPDLPDYGPSILEYVLAHEMGHALNLRHTGEDDSQYLGGDGMPVMATCLGGSSPTIPRNDDHAALTYAHAIGADRTLTADYGFEAGLRFFSASGAQPQHVTGSTSGGDYHIQVVPNSSQDNIVQTINFSAGASKIVMPTMQYATPGATSGNVRIELWSRPVTYTSSSNVDHCGYPIPNVDMNTRTPAPDDPSGWSLVKSNIYPLSNTWRVAEPASGYLVPTVTNGSVDLRIRVYTTAGISGGYIHTHYDDVRIQATS